MKKPLLSEMTLREKIGQMLAPHHWDVYGREDADFDRNNVNIEKVKSNYARDQYGTIRAEQVGVYYTLPENQNITAEVEGVVEGNLFGGAKKKIDSKTYRKFLEKHNSFMKIPALTGGDCSSGAANVFTDLNWVVNAVALGAADSEKLTFEFARALAREMRCGGLNWRWSPVVDIGNRNTSSTTRTFAIDDPERTVRLAKAYIDGLQSEGVAATVKHFPSEGRRESRDSHYSATSNDSTIEEWWSEQGKIYQELIDYGVYAVMIGHQSFPAVDSEMINGKYRPSTISKKVITDLLKDEMGFKGVVITDGIAMAGLFSLLPYEELIIELVNAGNDVILGSKMSSADLIEAAVLNGRIAESRIDDACQRVLDMKEKLGMFEEGYFDLPYEAEDIVEETRRISAEVARRSITLVQDRYNLLPLNKSDIKKVSIIISTHTDTFVEKINALKESFEKRGIEVYTQRRLSSSIELKKISDDSDLIIYAAYVQMHAPSGGMRLFGEECITFYHAFTHGKEKSIGVSFGYPYIHYDNMENANTFINAYNPQPETMEAFVQAILGEIEIVGKTPILLEPRANTK